MAKASSRICGRPQIGISERPSLATLNHNLLLAVSMPPVLEFPPIYASQQNGFCVQQNKATPLRRTTLRLTMRKVPALSGTSAKADRMVQKSRRRRESRPLRCNSESCCIRPTKTARAIESLAADLLKKAAATGDREAKMALAMLYLQGEGVARDPSRAKELLKQAAEGGHAGAALQLAMFILANTRRCQRGQNRATPSSGIRKPPKRETLKLNMPLVCCI